MKSLSHIYENIIDFDNIIHAMHTAMRGKKKTAEIRKFLSYDDICNNAEKIRQGIISGNLPQQSKRKPKIIHEPTANKDRTIYPPHKFEHVVHHLVCQQLETMFTKGMYEFCVASVPKRGGSYGKKFMWKWIKSYHGKKLYVLKLDIHHFFDTIDRQILFDKLSKRIKDKRFNEVLRKIIWYDGNENTVGIPIGFYTSQWFANFYLQDFDYFVKQELHIPHYMRYMDDMIFLCPNKRKLRRAYFAIVEYLKTLKLEINDNRQLFRFSYINEYGKEKGRAIDFMGYVFHVNRTTMRKRTLCRVRRKANKIGRRKKHNWYEATQIISMAGRLKGINVHKYFEKFILPKVNFKNMRELVSKHSKIEIHKRWCIT